MKMADQGRDVVGPLAKRRNHDGKHIEPEPQIFAKPPAADHLFQVLVGGADDAHVHGNNLRAAHPFDFVLLEHAQQPDLGRRRQLPDLVEKDRSRVGPFEASPLAGDGAGKRPLFRVRTARCP